jgi:hypothetical protein
MDRVALRRRTGMEWKPCPKIKRRRRGWRYENPLLTGECRVGFGAFGGEHGVRMTPRYDAASIRVSGFVA